MRKLATVPTSDPVLRNPSTAATESELPTPTESTNLPLGKSPSQVQNVHSVPSTPPAQVSASQKDFLADKRRAPKQVLSPEQEAHEFLCKVFEVTLDPPKKAAATSGPFYLQDLAQELKVSQATPTLAIQHVDSILLERLRAFASPNSQITYLLNCFGRAYGGNFKVLSFYLILENRIWLTQFNLL